MRYIVDANVLSEPTRSVPDQRAVAWLGAREGDLVVDPIVLGEMSAGILALPCGKKRVRLEAWFADVVRGIDCVPWDAEVGFRWARLVTDLRKKGRGDAAPGFADRRNSLALPLHGRHAKRATL